MNHIESQPEVGFSNVNRKIKIIKRYQNRKLYNTDQSCYLTLDDIAKMVRSGDQVRVIENGTKKDITLATLTMIAFNAEKRESPGAPLSILREIIRYGNGTLTDYLAKLGAFSKDDFEKQAALNLAQQANPGVSRNIDQHEEIIVAREATDSSASRNAATLALSSHAPSLNELDAPNLPTSNLSNI